jgi:hypothetical protein
MCKLQIANAQLNGLGAVAADVKLKVRSFAAQRPQRVLQSWSKYVVFAIQSALKEAAPFRIE